MALPDLTLYNPRTDGTYIKISDNSGPYVWDGAAMALINVVTGAITVSVPATFNTVVIMSLQTSAVGATWVAFGAQVGVVLDVVNATGTAMEYRRGGAGTSFTIPDGASRAIEGITNANQISMRRVDTSNVQVTLSAEAMRSV